MSPIERALRTMARDLRHGTHKAIAENAADAIRSLLEACQGTEHNLRQGAMCDEDLIALRVAIKKCGSKPLQPG